MLAQPQRLPTLIEILFWINSSCPHCHIVVKDKDTVTKHIQWVHEKVPCEQCGELVGVGKMKRHIASKHTSIYDTNLNVMSAAKVS